MFSEEILFVIEHYQVYLPEMWHAKKMLFKQLSTINLSHI